MTIVELKEGEGNRPVVTRHGNARLYIRFPHAASSTEARARQSRTPGGCILPSPVPPSAPALFSSKKRTNIFPSKQSMSSVHHPRSFTQSVPSPLHHPFHGLHARDSASVVNHAIQATSVKRLKNTIRASRSHRLGATVAYATPCIPRFSVVTLRIVQFPTSSGPPGKSMYRAVKPSCRVLPPQVRPTQKGVVVSRKERKLIKYRPGPSGK